MSTLSSRRSSIRIITITGFLMGLNIILSAMGIPVPGGHFYLSDVVICLAGLILSPFEAFMVGGVGSFLGDMLYYPDAMFVSLVTHGLQAAVIALIMRRPNSSQSLRQAITAVTVGAIIMVIGYTIGRSFVYSTPEYALIKLPFECLQAGFGAFFGVLLYRRTHLKETAEKYGIR
ncbi:MAG: ECF transporter S component [Solobacterium sp.]|nr:ECF transporter S component [Solobacterium sp.]